MSAAPDSDLGALAAFGDALLPRLDALRAYDPLHWSDASQCWVVTSNALVAEGFSGRLPLSAKRHQLIARFFPDPRERAETIGYILEVFPDFVLSADPPQQARLRRLLMTAFSKQVAESYRSDAREIVVDVLAAVGDRIEIDFVHDVARPITARIILRVMGLPSVYLARMEDWAVTINAGLSGDADRAMMAKTNRVMEEMRDLFLAEIDSRGTTRANDFVSQLLDARDGKDRLTRNGRRPAHPDPDRRARHDAQHDRAQHGAARRPAGGAVIHARSSGAVRGLHHGAHADHRDVDLDGAHRQRGLRVGRQDASCRPAGLPDDRGGEPRPADLSRAGAGKFPPLQNANMTFAPGKHFCIGHWFAKMMMSEIFPAFLDRYESREVLEDPMAFTPSIIFRGPLRLPMRLLPRRTD